MRVIIGITGASGIIYSIKLLEYLKNVPETETFLVISKHGKTVLEIETGYNIDYLKSLSDHYYEEDDFRAPIASGSFKFDSVVIVPSSMKTLAAIANGYADNLIARVADIALKQKKKLIIVPRETPLNVIHLENMLKLAKMGAIIMPACPGFYSRPKSIGDLVNFIVSRILDLLGIENKLINRWGEEW